MCRLGTMNILEKLKRKKRKKIWKQILRVLMCVVVFCTTYMLILPAITKEARTFCGHEEHTHEAACYQEAMVCQEHVHTEVCFPENGGPSCVLPGHTHTVAGQGQILICGKEEHTHLQSCFSDVTADTETEEDWMATLPQITGISRSYVSRIEKRALEKLKAAME